MQFGLFEERPHYETLDALIADMMAMDDDPLAAAGTNVVICRGNPQARLMIVGEAPVPRKIGRASPLWGDRANYWTRF
jgi:uracil-DNA glycosylase